MSDTSAGAVAALVAQLENVPVKLNHLDTLGQAAATLSALLARCEKAEKERDEAQRAKYGTPCKCQSWIDACGVAESERDDLQTRLAESEAYAAKQEKLAIEFSTKFDTAQQQLTAAQAREARLREALERIGWHELTWKEARDVARAALAQSPEQDGGAS